MKPIRALLDDIGRHSQISKGPSGVHRSRIRKVLVVGSVIVACVLAFFGTGYVKERLAVEDGELYLQQLGVFQEVAALYEDPPLLIGLLEIVVYDYPPDSRGPGRLDSRNLMKEAYSHCVRAIIKRLQGVTHEDFGENPETWIRQYREEGE